MYAEIVGLMPCRKNVHVWMPHFNAYAVVGRKTINPIKNRREDFDYVDFSPPQPQPPPPSPMVATTMGSGRGGDSGLTMQGMYDGGGDGAVQQQQQQPQQPEWLPAVLPSFCTVSAVSLLPYFRQLSYVASSSVPFMTQFHIFFAVRALPGSLLQHAADV